MNAPICMWLYTGCPRMIFNIGKAIPLQDWTGHEGFRRFRLPDFKTVGT